MALVTGFQSQGNHHPVSYHQARSPHCPAWYLFGSIFHLELPRPGWRPQNISNALLSSTHLVTSSNVPYTIPPLKAMLWADLWIPSWNLLHSPLHYTNGEKSHLVSELIREISYNMGSIGKLDSNKTVRKINPHALQSWWSIEAYKILRDYIFC